HPPLPGDPLGLVVAAADPSDRLEVIAALDSLNDTLIEKIVCKLLLGLADVEEPERAAILNDEQRVIDDHRVKPPPHGLLADLRTPRCRSGRLPIRPRPKRQTRKPKRQACCQGSELLKCDAW